eukprot:CAMPEP_0205999432 /NCGR_PEP_ID=MMETSP1464-20131121/850_1 /ASSEMBLY_ACC=CAM_ASM_001124 /TAXON_ID=119497 /ORGANISM="Exanthemachrysis gayraliae, Strain RCC1523" /LENGTH=34 /DNA_ID= /DNA_START= /DNA_END= /DNA_ORIENTATION=
MGSLGAMCDQPASYAARAPATLCRQPTWGMLPAS